MADNTFWSRVKHAWNAFQNRDPTEYAVKGMTYSEYPDGPVVSGGNDRTIINSVINRIALDTASLTYHHVKLDDQYRFSEVIRDDLDRLLNTEANIDETGKAFIQKAVLTMLDEGTVCLVPTYASGTPGENNPVDIFEARVGRILEWKPEAVRVELYNSEDGQKRQYTYKKRMVCIIQNPFYTIMNSSSSTMRRLVQKMNLLDIVDDKIGSKKLDVIVQLPYAVKNDLQKKRADERRKNIEDQIAGSKMGIAYIDAAEHITQLNRPVENNLLKSVEYYTNLLLSQLGMTTTILDGTADEKTMKNYDNKIVGPCADAIVEEIRRKWLTENQRTKEREDVMYFRDPWKLVPIDQMAELADKLTRNEICTSNEIRQGLGMIPSKDPKADQLVNSNLSQAKQDALPPVNSKTGAGIGGVGQTKVSDI